MLGALGIGSTVVLPGWENPAAWQLLAECRLRKLSTVALYESSELSQRHTNGVVAQARCTFFTHVDAVLTVGSASAAAVTAFGVDPDRIVVGRNTVDLDVYRSRESGPNDPGRRTAFVYVGQLIDRKNVPTLIAALALAPEDYTLDIIGEGPSEAAIRHAVNESGLHGRVTLHGYLEPKAIADVLDRMATLVLPSTEEVYGIAPAEALAAGLHVIVSERAGIKVDITEMAGVRVTAPTADALAAAMTSSSLAWNGPIPSPVIRRWTPERFAHEVLAATDIARQRTRPRRRPTRENRARRHADQR